MASRRRTATPVASNTFAAPTGTFILRAWQGLYHLFGARVERFDVSSEGVTAVNLTVADKWDVNSIVENLATDSKVRLNFFPLYNWVQGESPAPFSNSVELTNWQTQNIAAGDKGRRPKFIKDAIQDYKAEIGIAVPRGRPRKHFRLEVGEIDTSILEASDMEELEKLQETLTKVVASRGETVEA